MTMTMTTTVLLSPALSTFSDAELPIIPTDDLGMIADDETSPETQSAQLAAVATSTKKRNDKKPTRPRRTITYVSRHFVAESDQDRVASPVPAPSKRNRRDRRHRPNNAKVKKAEPDLKQQQQQQHEAEQEQAAPTLATPPVTPARPRPRPRPHPRIYYGLNIDELSSDSSLTDVPDDIGLDPFSAPAPSSTWPSAESALYSSRGHGQAQVQVQARSDTTASYKKGQKGQNGQQRRPTKSPYFPPPPKSRPTFLSTLPFPPLSHASFGLMQERLAHDPFRLLIATIFLNKTPGERAMPVFYQLMSRYPTPSDLAGAEISHITSIIYGLGFQNQRAKKCVAMAKTWISNPPKRGQRYRKLNYPHKGDGRDVRDDEVLDDQDPRVAWEISHLPGLGPYSHDSWRIFCRDELRGGRLVAEKEQRQGVTEKSKIGEGEEEESATITTSASTTASFEPEWKRVVPLDKELRAYLTWMWMKEGFIWNKETGQRSKAPEPLMAKARGGGIVVEERDSAHLLVKTIDSLTHDHDHDLDLDNRKLQGEHKVERPAGDFLPD